MRFLLATAQGLAGSFIAVLLDMLFSERLGTGRFQPWQAVSMGASIALGIGVKEQWKLSPGIGSVVVGLFGGAGALVGTWLSAHA